MVNRDGCMGSLEDGYTFSKIAQATFDPQFIHVAIPRVVSTVVDVYQRHNDIQRVQLCRRQSWTYQWIEIVR
jgi:hypothetical protein